MKSLLRVTVLLAAVGSPAFAGQDPTAGQERPVAHGHWPQWHGPNRDNVSTESGLLTEWPQGGPPLLWKVTELGDGFPPVSIAGGRIYGLGYRDGKEFVTALDGSGKVVWSQTIGPGTGEFTSMRFLSQRSITVDNELLYAFAVTGALLCLRSGDGQILWEKNYVKDFGGRPTSFFYADAPLVDGNLLICKPGGPRGSVVALNKQTGELVWQTKELKDLAAHSPLIVAEIGGVRQYVVLAMESVAGIVAQTGAVAWRADRHGATAVAPTPIYHDGIVFVTSGFGVGCNAFRITSEDGRFKAEEIYSGRQMSNHRGGLVRIGEHLYGTDDRVLKCIELKTGTVVWQDPSVGKSSVVAADGHLIVRNERGVLALVEASPAGYKEKGRFEQPERSKEPTLSHPVIAGGRLYFRDVTVLYCYDLRGPGYKGPGPVWKTPSPGGPAGAKRLPVGGEKGPDAAFVPTPQDVVEKMIELARITKDDVVYDLGSGDGRIVLTASKNHGCKSVGFEINPGLVWESRFKAKQAKLDNLVTIEEKNLFTVDLSPATVVTLYLGAPNNAKLLPQLAKLKPGSRIVSHAHLLGDAGPKPDQILKLTSKEDLEEHTVYVWTTPLKAAQEGK